MEVKRQRVKALLREMYPLLQLWVKWFLRSQRGGAVPSKLMVVEVAMVKSLARPRYRDSVGEAVL